MAVAPIVGIFVAGVQKAGTTSLHAHLAEHPRLTAPIKKETHFFDNEKTVDWSSPDYESFHRTFFPRHDGSGIGFDATPIYTFWKPSIARILRYNPEARFIMLLRDPIERAYSHWRMEVGRQADDVSFSEAIRDGRARLDGIPDLDPRRRVYSYVERGFYAAQFEALTAQAGPGRVLALDARRLLDDTARTLATIAGFLGIEPFADTAPRREHVRDDGLPPRPGAADIDHLRTLFRPDLARFAALSGIDVGDWLTMRSDG